MLVVIIKLYCLRGDWFNKVKKKYVFSWKYFVLKWIEVISVLKYCELFWIYCVSMSCYKYFL